MPFMRRNTAIDYCALWIAPYRVIMESILSRYFFKAGVKWFFLTGWALNIINVC